MLRAFLTVLVGALVPGQVFALTIAETDTGYSFAPTIEIWSTFDLEVGTNTLSGNLSECGFVHEGPPTDADAFITICRNDVTDAFRLNLLPGFQIDEFDLSAPLSSVIPSVAPGQKGARTYDFFMNRGADFQQVWSLSISISQLPDVGEVPLPAGLSLLVAGLDAFGAMKGRSKRVNANHGERS
ncbi:MAG: VPLPA-CTERM sorting domain-containing protein [Pseudomonadota bacterium]